MAIDWEMIQELGEQGLLTADEAGALCGLAMSRVAWLEIHLPKSAPDGLCPWCWSVDHSDNCPIPILEAAGERADDS